MRVVTEDTAKTLIGRPEAFEAVASVFTAMARDEARNSPVVREALGHAHALYGFKSGFDTNTMAPGVKVGGYWPGNADQGLTNHKSTVCLFDPDRRHRRGPARPRSCPSGGRERKIFRSGTGHRLVQMTACCV